MGHYTRFVIGNFHWEFKYQVPYFLLFLFDEGDFIYKKEEYDREELEGGNEIVEEDEYTYDYLGYRTTARKALEKLNKYGFSLNFFEEIYREFQDDIDSYYEWIIGENIAKDFDYKKSSNEIEELIPSYIKNASKLDYSPIFPSSESNIESFINFLKACLNKNKFKKLLNRMIELGAKKNLLNQRSEFIKKFPRWMPDWMNIEGDASKFLDIEMLCYFVSEFPVYLPPSIPKVGYLIDTLKDDYPDVIGLMLSRLILHCADENSNVCVDLTDIVDENPLEEAKNMHQWVQQEIVRKISIYNKAFGLLSGKDEHLKTVYTKQRLRSKLVEIKGIDNSQKKGEFFEEFIRNLFAISNELFLVDSRLNLGDEEVDLVYKNNINRPFWYGINTPHIFVECRNWNSRVSTKELRDFETKVRDHKNLCKLGLLISYNGFTSECVETLKRMGRDEIILVLIEKSNIEKFIETSMTFYDWLEGLVSSALV